MLKKIADIAGFPYRENDQIIMSILKRIEGQLPVGTTENDSDFEEKVLEAEKKVNAQGAMAIGNLVKQITAPEPEKVLKIKSSPKGDRLEIAAPNGIRYSFGPIWNASVIKGKGIALAEANREKLNHQGILAGIENPADMDVKALAAAIATTLPQE